MSENINPGLKIWKKHYANRLGEVTIQRSGKVEHQRIFLFADCLKDNNYPRLFSHGKPTKNVLVLTHGLSDSPWYVEQIALRFFQKGINVLLPLLPAHGLKDPDVAFEDFNLDQKWREEIDKAVEVAAHFGKTISIGGFSTGGALSLNKILRDSESIRGALFLFAGALSIGAVADRVGGLGLVQKIVQQRDGKIIGIGQDPYKYPLFPNFGGTELAQIIRQNNTLSAGKKVQQPVFAAHSVHDETADLQGIISFLTHHTEKGEAFLMSQAIRHAETPLAVDVPLNKEAEHPPSYEPKANPMFEEMMAAALHFFEKTEH